MPKKVYNEFQRKQSYVRARAVMSEEEDVWPKAVEELRALTRRYPILTRYGVVDMLTLNALVKVARKSTR